jgi:hypothetical protein
LQEQLINWPDANNRQEIREEFIEVGFEGCFGVIEGTLVILQDCPAGDRPEYYNRKGSYGISTLLICNNQKIMLNFKINF